MTTANASTVTKIKPETAIRADNGVYIRRKITNTILLTLALAALVFGLVWLVWILLSIKNLQPSLIKIICASVFLTASSSIIFIFK